MGPKMDKKNESKSTTVEDNGTQAILARIELMDQKNDKRLDEFTFELIQLREDLSKQQESINRLVTESKDLKAENAKIKKDLANLNEQQIRLENLQNQKNLIVTGLLEKPDEKLVKTLEDMFKQKLTIHLNLDFAHQLGKETEGAKFPRPIKLGFLYKSQQDEIWEKRRDLKGSNIFLNEDIPRQQRIERALLRKHKKEAEEDGSEVSLKGNLLTIDGRKFTIRDGRLQSVSPRS